MIGRPGEDAQVRRLIGQRVIAFARGQRVLADAVAPDPPDAVAVVASAPARRIPVHERRAAGHLIGEARIGIAVDPALCIRRHRERTRA